AGPVDERRLLLADAVLEEGVLRRRVAVRVRTVRLPQLLADLALEECGESPRLILCSEDRERVGALAGRHVHDVERSAGLDRVAILVPAEGVLNEPVDLELRWALYGLDRRHHSGG